MNEPSSAVFDPADCRHLRRFIFRELKRIDPRWQPAHVSFSAAMVLCACACVGVCVPILSQITGHSEKFCRTVVDRLRRERVIRGDTLRLDWDHDGLRGEVAFIADALVAAGHVTRRWVDPTKQAKAKSARAARKANGMCGNCGRPAPAATCVTCRAAMKQSAERLKARMAGTTLVQSTVVKADPRYQITDVGRQDMRQERER